MNNKLEALKYFCILAETLQFREAANKLSVSPSVVTRVIGDLEHYLGEPLFQRNTRTVKITDFGQRLLPQAQQLIAQTNQFFIEHKNHELKDSTGIVRISLPEAINYTSILEQLLQELKNYPYIQLDWRIEDKRINLVEQQIDIGIRIGTLGDQSIIARKIGYIQEKIVASPDYLQRYGFPQNAEHLAQNFPLTCILNPNTGRAWAWQLGENLSIKPQHIAFYASDISSNLQSALSHIAVAQTLEWVCQPFIKKGKLIELLPELPKYTWDVYIYRHSHSIHIPRVKIVYEKLAALLAQWTYTYSIESDKI